MGIDSARRLTAAGVQADIREGDPQHDSIDGVTPRLIIEPHTPEAAAASLAWATDQHLSVVIRGAGTKIGWGRPPQTVDVILSTRHMNRVLAHRAGDLTVAVEAGAVLGDLNRALAAHGQMLPLDPLSGDRATIGGLLAANESGPHRHRFGTPRDLVIGVQLATADGRLAKAGGQVVKNVAGYDLSKLVSGSFGGLAAIVSATFKLSPAPSASGTVMIAALDSAAVARIAAAMAASQLEPVAFELHAQWNERRDMAASCLLRFASFADAVERRLPRSHLSGFVHVLDSALTGEAERDLWREHSAHIAGGPGAIVRVSWSPAEFSRALDELGSVAEVGTWKSLVVWALERASFDSTATPAPGGRSGTASFLRCVRQCCRVRATRH